MMPQLRLLLSWVCLGAILARAEDIVYVTDLSIFTVLVSRFCFIEMECERAKSNMVFRD